MAISIDESNRQNNRLPERIFAAGDEPTGDRVNLYHKPKSIDSILSALTVEEIEFLKRSNFGKLIATSEKPSFSGSFGQYMITRMLKVSKKHEIWFLFSGKPIRVSLREFAIVTGLPCGPYPKRHKKRTNLVKQKPYWPELFGLLPSMSVENVIRKLKKRKVDDKDLRLKYACLALTSSVLCPSSHKPKIIKEHAELIRDLDEFFSYPWGRLAFEKLMSSIKAKDVIALAQSTVALKGFVQAIQLVLVEVVPAITEVVQVDELTSESENESEGEEDEGAAIEDEAEKSDKTITGSSYNKLSLSPGHAREMDEGCKAVVHSIIAHDPTMEHMGTDFAWSDEEEDEEVDHMVNLILEGHTFKREMFTGGLSSAELERIRIERKDAKEKKDKEKSPEASDTRAAEAAEHAAPERSTVDYSLVAHIVAEKIGDALSPIALKLSNVEEKLNRLHLKSSGIEDMVAKAIDRKMSDMQQSIVAAISDYLKKIIVAYAEEAEDESQQDRSGQQLDVDGQVAPSRNANEIIAQVIGDVNEPTVVDGEEQDGNNDDQMVNEADRGPHTRKSTRNRSQPSQLQDYQVGAKKRKIGREITFNLLGNDPAIDYAAKFSSIRERLTKNSVICIGNGTSVNGEDVVVVAERSIFMLTKVMDALMSYTSDMFERIHPRPNHSRVDFFDTKFTSCLHKHNSKFVRTAVKDKRKFKWPDVIVDYFGLEDGQPLTFQRIYFPFNVDKTHWVGVCVDVASATMEVLDCNTAKRTDRAMKEDLKSLSQMLPYLTKINADSSTEEKPLTITRAKGIPQIKAPNDSGVMTVLLIHAHSVVGIDGCRSITSEAIAEEAVKLAVLFYEEYAQSL